jgi:transposase
MSSLEELHEQARHEREQYERTAAQLRDAVADALASGVRAVDIAARLGVTRSRVYQWARKD